jgi:3-oxoacyl-[acyl-carrier protein] reductase
MDLGISERTAIVCGATAGLGEATARALGREGAQVVLAGRRGERAKQIAADLPSAVGIGIDLTSPHAADELAALAEAEFGPADIVILNGPGPPPLSAADIGDQDVLNAVASLFLPHRRLVTRVLAGMRERHWGRILAIGSSGVVTPLPGLATSNAARSALGAYLKTLANEVAVDGVTVNMVIPGRISTDRVASLDSIAAKRSGLTVEEISARSAGSIPLGRYGTVDEFAAVATFLCSRQASYITGSAIRCDGGLAPIL